jgi:predicted RNA-binding protein (virulence factor B family)
VSVADRSGESRAPSGPLPIGRSVQLPVLRAAPPGLILDAEGCELLLPNKYAPEGAAPGDRIDVFIYTDSEDRPVATTQKPFAQADEFACLRVKAVNATGAFLDWGLDKDLLLPVSQQAWRINKAGVKLVVRVYCDAASQRMVASSKLNRFLTDPPPSLREGQEVKCLLYERTDLGWNAIVDGRFAGLLHVETKSKAGTRDRGPDLGQRRTAWVQKIRSDGKVNLTLTPSGARASEKARYAVLDALRTRGGRLPLGDKSDPEEIRAILGLSKKAFKRAIGGLFKERLIAVSDESIESTLDDGPAEPTRSPRVGIKSSERRGT